MMCLFMFVQVTGVAVLVALVVAMVVAVDLVRTALLQC